MAKKNNKSKRKSSTTTVPKPAAAIAKPNRAEPQPDAKEEPTVKPEIVAEPTEETVTEPEPIPVTATPVTATPVTATPAAADTATDTVSPPLPFDAFKPSMTADEITLATALCTDGQHHLFEHWAASTDNAAKKSQLAQLTLLNKTYPLPNGLLDYTSNARTLLGVSKAGLNPLEGWAPSVPTGQSLSLNDLATFKKYEDAGTPLLKKTGFVLVAGGLGERLGFSDIKISLPTELATETSYIKYYIETIKAYDKNCPLAIMVSDDTHDKTVALLTANAHFGMPPSNITIMKQEKVAAISSNDGHIAQDEGDKFVIDSKPHGHGDVHSLLHSTGTAASWLAAGLEYVVFFQDTNGLGFHTLPAALGVSKEYGFVMNSLAIPRKAKQAVGALCKLENAETAEVRTINVEYNQLDPLLRATINEAGDVDDEATGFSPFPGNINQLLFSLPEYAAALERTSGVMAEFVNPKYADEEKTVFKKATRLECMMQDYPMVLTGEDAKRVGFTSVPASLCFSPVKNAVVDGATAQKKGTAPAVAASGEADQYNAVRMLMRSVGCEVEEGEVGVWQDVSVVVGPKCVVSPEVACRPGMYGDVFVGGSKVRVSGRSSLVVKGKGKVTVESLDLDGALVIDASEGDVVVKDVVVKNKGWVDVKVEGEGVEEWKAMRGYELNKIETCVIWSKRVEGEGLVVAKKEKEVEVEVEVEVEEKESEQKKEEVVAAKSVETQAVAEVSEVVVEEKKDGSVQEVGTGEANECGCNVM